MLVTKYRFKVLVDGVDKYLKIKFGEIRKYYPEIEIVEVNIQADHVHLVLNFPPKYSIAQVVQIIKTNSGSSLRFKFDFIKQRYRMAGSIWSTGYFVATVGLDEHMILDYVKYQQEQDSGQAKLAF